MFKEGNNLGGGRPKGSTNKKTDQWLKLHSAITGKHAKTFNKLMTDLANGTPEEKALFMSNYTKILNYFKPKSTNMNIENLGENGLTINVKYQGQDD